MDIIEYLTYLVVLYMVGMVVLFYRYLKRRGKVPVEEIYPDKTFRIIMAKPLDGAGTPKIKMGNDQVNYTPSAVFFERKPMFRFWRAPTRKLYHINGLMDCLTFKDQADGDKSGLIYAMTKGEVKELVRSEQAKAKANVSPFKRMEFVIIMVLIGAVLAMQFYIMLRVGI